MAIFLTNMLRFSSKTSFNILVVQKNIIAKKMKPKRIFIEISTERKKTSKSQFLITNILNIEDNSKKNANDNSNENITQNSDEPYQLNGCHNDDKVLAIKQIENKYLANQDIIKNMSPNKKYDEMQQRIQSYQNNLPYLSQLQDDHTNHLSDLPSYKKQLSYSFKLNQCDFFSTLDLCIFTNAKSMRKNTSQVELQSKTECSRLFCTSKADCCSGLCNIMSSMCL
ncbi:hypothetical protein ABPG74_007100 [Tetrahymena malaccensis]